MHHPANDHRRILPSTGRLTNVRFQEKLKFYTPTPTGTRDLPHRAQNPGPNRHSPSPDCRPLGQFRSRHPNAHAGEKSRRSEPLSSPQNFQKFSFRSFLGVWRPNASRDSVRVRFGKFSDMIFGNRLIVFGF
jgi:hypothetical protein